jgi:hypothetical protein
VVWVSEPGKDINTFMNRRITVQGEETVLQINAGLNDAWCNPDTDGQGFFITVFPDPVRNSPRGGQWPTCGRIH